MESTETISPPSFWARAKATADLPTPVGPARNRDGMLPMGLVSKANDPGLYQTGTARFCAQRALFLGLAGGGGFYVACPTERAGPSPCSLCQDWRKSSPTPTQMALSARLNAGKPISPPPR